MPRPKKCLRVTALPDQLDDFNDHDKISDFSSISQSLCPSGYKLQIDKSRAVFYKLENCNTFGISTVAKPRVTTRPLFGGHVFLFGKSNWFSEDV